MKSSFFILMRGFFSSATPITRKIAPTLLLIFAVIFGPQLTAQAVPVIASFSPAAGLVGTNVVIRGENFSPVAGGDIVYFGAVKAVVEEASVTNLTVKVPAGATYAPITVTVGGLTGYSPTAFIPTFNGDGSGISSSSFATRQDMPAGNNAYRVLIADMDGDGKPDLVVVNTVGNSVSLYRNISTNGVLTAASFAPRVDLATPAGPLLAAVADVDGDGRLDVIVADSGADSVSVYHNDCSPGNISADAFTRVDFATGSQPQGVAVGDVDGDGKPDIVTANVGDGTISILRNTGVKGSLTTNSFAPKVDFATGNQCCDVVLGDLDGDGRPDVATVNNGAGTVSLLRNLSAPGSLVFAPEVELPTLANPVRIAMGDLDGDGKPDLSVTCYLPQTVSVFRNISVAGSLGTNSFAPRIDFGLGGRGHTPAIGDLDGDGKPDLAVVTEISSMLSVFRNTSTPGSFTNDSFAGRVDFSTGYNAWGISIGDLNGDGRPDIIFCNQYDSTLSIYQNIVPFGGRPVINEQPTNQITSVGSNVVFNVVAGGTKPLHYQWNFNLKPIPDATNSMLVLTNVEFSQAGSYMVQVTNRFGSVNSSNALLVINDRLDHFVWNSIPLARFINTPFSVTLKAMDATNGLFTNFNGSVTLSTTNGLLVNPTVSANFVQGVWSGSLTLSELATNLVLRADDGHGEFGLSNPINILDKPSLSMVQSGESLFLFWPAGSSNFVLEASSSLSPANWTQVVVPRYRIGDQYLETVSISTFTNNFYRLRFTGH